MQQRTILFLAIFACFIATAFSDLSIVSPEDFRKWWKSHPSDTETSLGAFGYIPWGRKIRSQLMLADPLDACDYLKQGAKEYASHPMIVAKRGNCTFVQKAHYAQLAGASMMLIVDDKYEDVKLHLMVDKSGLEESIRIPAVLLTKSAGDRMISVLQDSDPSKSTVHAIYDFNLTKTDIVKYNVWLSSSSPQSFRFIRDWIKYENDFGQNTQLTPHYAHYKYSDNPANCLCKGKYCADDPDNEKKNTGADVLIEDLRQVCLFELYPNVTFMAYMTLYDTFCLTNGDMKKCGNNAVRMAGGDEKKVQECIELHFDTRDPYNCNSNRYFDREAEDMVRDGVFYTPYININGMPFRGSVFPVQNVFEAICGSFTNAPTVCQHFLRTTTTIPGGASTVMVMIGILCFVVGVALVIFCFFRKALKAEMRDKVQKDVTIMLEQYRALRDEKPDHLETL